MDAFVTPLIGGLMIGVAAMLLLATLGRVAGITGVIWGAVTGLDRDWRLLFLVGIIAGAALVHAVLGIPAPSPPTGAAPLAVVAGLIVGIGTRMGSGCTSGHGVCGIGRLSRRSLVATATFMTTGIITVALFRHVFGGLL